MIRDSAAARRDVLSPDAKVGPEAGVRRSHADVKPSEAGRGTSRARLANVTPRMLRDIWMYTGRFLGLRRRRLLLEPPLALLIAIIETLQLLLVLRLLLLLVGGEASVKISFAGLSVEAGFISLASVAGALTFVNLGFRVLESRLVGGLAAEATSHARNMLFESYFAADWQQLQSERLGRLQQLLGVNAQQATTPVITFCTMSLACITLALYGIVIAVMAPVVGLTFLALAIGVTLLLRPLRGKSKRGARQASASLRELQVTATTYAQLNRELHVFAAHHAATRHLEQLNGTISEQFRQVRTNARLIPALFQQMLLSGVLFIVFVSWVLDLDASALGAAAVLALRSMSYVQQVNTATLQFIEAKPFLSELTHAIDTQRSARRRTGDEPLAHVDELQLDGVTFTYADGREALRTVSLRLRRGEWIGVIGPSGGGKTTLANLLVGLLTPTSGSYLVNARPATDYRSSDWKSRFAILSQEPVLLRATVAENIEFHRSADANAVRGAAERASVLDDITRQPYGFETLVGDGFGALSGGQRQRVALARALLTDPDVLILDEPTSALDLVNSSAVEAALQKLSSDTIVVVVSHRRNLLSRCNRFIRLEQGVVVAEGSALQVGLDELVGGDEEAGPA